MPDHWKITVRLEPLKGLDAIAVRSGDKVLVQMSSSVPKWARTHAYDYLLCALDNGETEAGARMATGQAVQVALSTHRSKIPLPRSAKMVAAAAGMVLPTLGAVTALLALSIGAEQTVLPAPAGPDAIPPVAGPANPPAAPEGEVNTVDATPDAEVVTAPVSIHPPKKIVRAAPIAVGTPPEQHLPAAPPTSKVDPKPTIEQPQQPPQLSGGWVRTSWNPRLESAEPASPPPGPAPKPCRDRPAKPKAGSETGAEGSA